MPGTKDFYPIPNHPDLPGLDEIGPASNPRIAQPLLDGLWLQDDPETKRLEVGTIPNGATLMVQNDLGDMITLVKNKENDDFTMRWVDHNGTPRTTPQIIIVGTSIGPSVGFREGGPEVIQFGYLHCMVSVLFRPGELDPALAPFEQSDQEELRPWIEAFDTNPEDLDSGILAGNMELGSVVTGTDGRLYWDIRVPMQGFGPIKDLSLDSTGATV